MISYWLFWELIKKVNDKKFCCKQWQQINYAIKYNIKEMLHNFLIFFSFLSKQTQFFPFL